MSAEVVNLNRGSFVREMLDPAYVEPAPAPRFELRGWAGGYRIYEHGQLITTFHGPQFELAARLLRMLQADAA